MSDANFAGLHDALPANNLPSFKAARFCTESLSFFAPKKYDCCIESCMAYTGRYEADSQCRFCKTSRSNADGHPRRQFTYLPIIPRLVAMYRNCNLAEELRYRHNYKHRKGTVNDIFDGRHYRRLRKRFVKVDGHEYSHRYFEDAREIALGVSTDGYAPFNRRKKTCWPIIIFLYNLPPEIRFLMKHVLCAGVIPGPNKPKDFDSFLWPLIEELKKLAVGERAFDAVTEQVFLIRAHLIAIFGDIPAISMVMKFKGHNGKCPCRMCAISGLRIPGEGGTTHYVPLDRSCHPDVQTDSAAIQVYDPGQLPLRSHTQIVQQAFEVDSAPTASQAERLSKSYGIKGTSILMQLGSIEFPSCFPYDFMHLLYENVLKNLILLWTGAFKGLDEGNGSYELMPSVWEAVGKATASSGRTIPSAFTASPPNVESSRFACTADTWSFWLLYLGPILLRKRFRSQAYFKHFVKLAKLVHLCIKFEMTQSDIDNIRDGFQSWVLDYERFVVQFI
jgi:hypothetical protein